eukprot:1206155-Amorphochlora_amoeboformis.AAC.1
MENIHQLRAHIQGEDPPEVHVDIQEPDFGRFERQVEKYIKEESRKTTAERRRKRELDRPVHKVVANGSTRSEDATEYGHLY